MKIKRILGVLLAAGLLLSGCGVSPEETTDYIDKESTQTLENIQSQTAETVAVSDMFTNRDKEIGYDETVAAVITLSGNTAQTSSENVEISGGVITITGEGTYILSGVLNSGMVIVDTGKADKVQIVLNNASVNSENCAALYIRQADKVFVTLAENSENTLKSTGEYATIDDNNIDAAIFSKEDLTLNGYGKLTVESDSGHGIISKDDLVITGGTYFITAKNHGISGKDSVRIANGSFEITSGKDGIRAENDEDASLGFLYIASGSFIVNADGDCLSASSWLQAGGGNFTLTAGGGNENTAMNQSVSSLPTGAQISGLSKSAQSQTEETASTKGIKAAGNLTLNAGTYEIDSVDDAIHANGDIIISGGDYQLSTGDDGVHADGIVQFTGGTMIIEMCYEGIEGLGIEISGGEIRLTSSDDGLNAAGGADGSGFGGVRGEDQFSEAASSYIQISGGTLYVNASGDGIDSNGTIQVSGGEVYVSGSDGAGDGALDYDGEAQITGGLFVAAGTSQMAQNFSSTSTQGSILVSVGSQQPGSTVQLTNGAGNILAEYTPEKQYDCVVISCPEAAVGETYTVTAGTEEIIVTMDSLIYGTGGMKGGRGGMNGGQGGKNTNQSGMGDKGSTAGGARGGR